MRPYGSSFSSSRPFCRRNRFDLRGFCDPQLPAGLAASPLLELWISQSEAIQVRWICRHGSISGAAATFPMHGMPDAVLRATFPGTGVLEETA